VSPTASLNPWQERLLVARAQQGDASAFHVLVQAYESRLLYFIRRFERDEHRAADVMQEVWLTVFQQLRRLRSAERFRSWVYRIAHDRVVTQVRKDLRVPDASDVSDADVASVDEFVRSELAEAVHEALGRLSAEHRAVLTLRFLEDLSLVEMADVLSEPLGTVKSRLFYAKETLRRCLQEERVHE
jgi:RNA polymerase sigma-70 factor (ECF subfamily)